MGKTGRPIASAQLPRSRVIPPGVLGADAMGARDEILITALEAAVATLTEKLGPDMSGWQLGQEAS